MWLGLASVFAKSLHSLRTLHNSLTSLLVHGAVERWSSVLVPHQCHPWTSMKLPPACPHITSLYLVPSLFLLRLVFPPKLAITACIALHINISIPLTSWMPVLRLHHIRSSRHPEDSEAVLHPGSNGQDQGCMIKYPVRIPYITIQLSYSKP